MKVGTWRSPIYSAALCRNDSEEGQSGARKKAAPNRAMYFMSFA
jgi:hypothetical protein